MVRAIMIVEMAGRPAEHLKESLEKHVGILREVKDIEVHEIKISEPRVIPREDKKSEEMFSSFAECDFECESFARLSETMFDFMPSSVEVIEPGKVGLSMDEATSLLNNISGRLHRYDEIAKILGEKYKQMEGQLIVAKKILDAKDTEITKLKNDNNKTNKKKISKKRKISRKK
jgi:hypothetical protein